MIALLTKLPPELLLEKRASIGIATLMIVTPMSYAVKRRAAGAPIECLHQIETYSEVMPSIVTSQMSELLVDVSAGKEFVATGRLTAYLAGK